MVKLVYLAESGILILTLAGIPLTVNASTGIAPLPGVTQDGGCGIFEFLTLKWVSLGGRTGDAMRPGVGGICDPPRALDFRPEFGGTYGIVDSAGIFVERLAFILRRQTIGSPGGFTLGYRLLGSLASLLGLR